MTREELEAYLAERESSLGLLPGEFRSIWKQESGGALDPNIKGPALSRGRGNALGPFQVVPYYHPGFPAAGSLKEQADFASSLYAKGGQTLEDRTGAYYGRGQAPKGHPTTAQYAQQVRARLDPQNIETPKENAMPADINLSALDEEQKRREYMDYVARMAQMRQQQQPQYAEPEMPPQREMNMYEKMMTNPLTQMGAAIMASSGTDWGRPLGMGVMAANNAVHNRQQAENELWELQQKRKESQARTRLADRKLQQEDMSIEEVNRMADYYDAKGEPEKGMQIRSGLLKTINPASYGTTPHYERDPKTGAVNVVRYANDGTKTVEPAKGMPFSVESKLPEFQGQVAQSKAGAEVVGKDNATKTIEAPQVIAKSDAAIRTADQMLSHPGLEKAVGLPSAFPTIPGSDAADYQALFSQAGGQLFLQAFDGLRGGGQITETEGLKATQAINPLSMKQSPEAHRESLRYAKELAEIAKKRAAQGYNAQNPYRGPDYVRGAAPAAAGGGWGIRPKGN